MEAGDQIDPRAARVAARYAKAPSYSEVLAAEAANAVRAAEAAAQAAREAQQAAQAVTDALMASVEAARNLERDAGQSRKAGVREHTAREITQAQYHVDPASLPAARDGHGSRHTQSSSVDPHPHVVDPLEEALVAPAQPLPARLLEFPRELVAARKARPRIAEGPLRDQGTDPRQAQLRIFEVEPETISNQPPIPAAEDAVLPEWSSIRLDATPRHVEADSMAANSRHSGNQNTPFSSRAARPAASNRGGSRRTRPGGQVPLHVAPIGDRLMAALVDIGLVVFAFLLFAAVFVACTAHPPSGRPALIASALALVGFFVLYQWLFFTFADATPGMRFAKIALCTFNDENPGRKTLQHRIGALFLAAIPLGLGFLWVLLDDDGLGWHDRMTRTYQRSYR
jgi:uncharacterized RDD family membrane protein YckC